MAEKLRAKMHEYVDKMGEYDLRLIVSFWESLMGIKR